MSHNDAACVGGCRPNFGILHVSGRVDRRQLKKNKPPIGSQDVSAHDDSPVLVASTSSDNESVDCQEIVLLNANQNNVAGKRLERTSPN